MYKEIYKYESEIDQLENENENRVWVDFNSKRNNKMYFRAWRIVYTDLLCDRLTRNT